MVAQTDKCKQLLNKLSSIDYELNKFLTSQNNLDTVKFVKIDDTLYYNIQKTDQVPLCWYGYDRTRNKDIRFYIDTKPVNIYLYFDKDTSIIQEIEFYDWTGEVCNHQKYECIDIAINSEIKIEYS